MGYQGPNFTQVPNLCLDEHLPEMGHAETKVVLAIIRQTFGWHKQKDRLSISQLMSLTGLSNRAVIDGVRAAIGRGVIAREKDGNSYAYWLVVDDGGGENASQADGKGVKKAHTPCENTSQEGVKKAHTQKKVKKPSKERPAREGEGGGPPTRDGDPPGVRVWVEVTGERPTISTRETLKNAFTRDDAPRWDEVTFRKVVREAYQNVGRDAGRIRIGYLMTSYEKMLARQGDGAPAAHSTPDDIRSEIR